MHARPQNQGEMALRVYEALGNFKRKVKNNQQPENNQEMYINKEAC